MVQGAEKKRVPSGWGGRYRKCLCWPWRRWWWSLGARDNAMRRQWGSVSPFLDAVVVDGGSRDSGGVAVLVYSMAAVMVGGGALVVLYGRNDSVEFATCFVLLMV